jgi:hypothetical protein
MSTAVTSPDLLSSYLGIRNSIDAIHDMATSIEGDVGRAQIYCEPDAIERALQRVKSLMTTMELLDSQLHSCVDPQPPVAEGMNGLAAAQQRDFNLSGPC